MARIIKLEVVTVKQAASMLGASEQTIVLAIGAGILDVVKDVKGKKHVLLHAVAKILDGLKKDWPDDTVVQRVRNHRNRLLSECASRACHVKYMMDCIDTMLERQIAKTRGVLMPRPSRLADIKSALADMADVIEAEAEGIRQQYEIVSREKEKEILRSLGFWEHNMPGARFKRMANGG